MAITLKRQLTDDEKASVDNQHGRKCFATGHAIPEDESVHYDHIRAFASGGLSEINNIAPMCPQHNRDKGTLPLLDFRAKLQLNDFFTMRDRLTLGDLLTYLRSKGDISDFGLPVIIHENGETLKIESSAGLQEARTYYCPITGWKYFYATLPVDLIDSDDSQDQTMGLQPRYLIFDKVFELFRHFQRFPVLQPSLGRIVDNKIKLFDGQHKAAAILWNGHRKLECKIYVRPDIRLLNQTNISAHEKFAQTRFFSSIMVLKLGTQFGVDFEAYKNLEDGQVKSEAGFANYLRDNDKLTRSEINDRFRSFLYNLVLQDENNRLARLVAPGNHPTDDKPLTTHALTNSLFMSFLYRDPVTDNLTSDAYKRDSELRNMVALMNMLYDSTLYQWNANAPGSDDNQTRLRRLVRSRFMKAWSALIKDAICAKVRIHDSDDQIRPFYRDFNEQELDDIGYVVTRLIDWKMWSEPVSSEIESDPAR